MDKPPANLVKKKRKIHNLNDKGKIILKQFLKS